MPDLEQERAAVAWKAAEEAPNKDYENLAKAAPALIMGNGLMQTLAYFQGKGKDHHIVLNRQLLNWLCKRFKGRKGFPAETEKDKFGPVMKALYEADSVDYRQATEEALALLKWIRQFAPAVKGGMKEGA